MQVRLRTDPGQGLLHGCAHSDFVDVAHVEDFDADLGQEALFPCVDTANADLANLVWQYRRYSAAASHLKRDSHATDRV